MSSGTITSVGLIGSNDKTQQPIVSVAVEAGLTNTGLLTQSSGSILNVSSGSGYITSGQIALIDSSSGSASSTSTVFSTGGTITNGGIITSTSGGETIDFTSGTETSKGTIGGTVTVTPVIPVVQGSLTITNTGTITNNTSDVAIEIDESMGCDVTVYNYGKIMSDDKAISFDGGYGKVINAAVIEGDVSVDASHEGDYVINIGDVDSIEIVSDQGYNTELKTGEVFGVIKGDTNFVQGNIGSKDDDIIEADGAAQNIFGLDGDDWIFAFGGDDVIYAGEGDDVISAGSGDDKIVGGEGNDFISGGEGDDLLIGGNGHDNIISGEGSDIILGGFGSDIFIFGESDSHTGSVDIVLDFEQGEDKISLVGNVDSFDELSFFKFNGNTAIASTALDNDFVLFLKGDYDLTAQDFYFGAGNSGVGVINIGTITPITNSGFVPVSPPIVFSDSIPDDSII